jgi:hypothetical protein
VQPAQNSAALQQHICAAVAAHPTIAQEGRLPPADPTYVDTYYSE